MQRATNSRQLLPAKVERREYSRTADGRISRDFLGGVFNLSCTLCRPVGWPPTWQRATGYPGPALSFVLGSWLLLACSSSSPHRKLFSGRQEAYKHLYHASLRCLGDTGPQAWARPPPAPFSPQSGGDFPAGRPSCSSSISGPSPGPAAPFP